MDVSEWQARLEENFSGDDGIIGQNLMPIIELERDYWSYVESKFRGYRVLNESFYSFYVETMQRTNHYIKDGGWPKERPEYSTTLLHFVTNFRSMRAAETLLMNGYPTDGYGLYRDLKDRALFISAIIQGLTSFPKLSGISNESNPTETISDEEYKNVKRRRKAEEHRLLKIMIRKDSGLSENTLDELNHWENMFHDEVHGSRFSMFVEGGRWLKGEGPLPLGPIPNDRAITLFTNRSWEICWMHLRLLPYIQLGPVAFGDDWARRWGILDDSFRIGMQELSDMGKKFADAVIELVDVKFPFTPETSYIERS